MNESETSILVIDDEQANIDSLSLVLSKENFKIFTALDAETALEVIRNNTIHLAITDLKMPGMDGLELLKTARSISPEVEFIVVTAFGTVETAVNAMKDGAYDFISKPIKRSILMKTIKRALEKQSLAQENKLLKEKLKNIESEKKIIGSSPIIKSVIDLIKQTAPSNASVLIQGESGTGKELIANAVHQLSNRCTFPLISVNCAAIPDNLIESELFGYEQGAFTGATSSKPGRFELANKGTLFLDEIAELNFNVQSKLLRFLQEGEIERVGSNKVLHVDARIVSATNRNLEKLIEEKKFREDLYYRLNVIKIEIPPLREHPDDVPILAHYFLNMYNEKNNRRIETISKLAMDLLCHYNWPGNVRELENTIERAIILTKSESIQADDLPSEIHKTKANKLITIPVGTPLNKIEKIFIDQTLTLVNGNKTIAAKLLGINPRTIYRKLGCAEKEASVSSDKEMTM